MCKSNSYLAHRIVVLGSESKKEILGTQRLELSKIFTNMTQLTLSREKPLLSPAWREALAVYRNHWHSEKQDK